MGAKFISEKKFEEMIVTFLRISVGIFTEEKEEVCLKAHERRGIDIEDEVSDELLDEMSREVDERLLNNIINELRSFFNEFIDADSQTFDAISYLIKRYEGSIEKLKSGGKIKKFTFSDLITNPEIHLDEYLEFLDKAIQKLKFEFEVI